ncbi:SETMR methyltransferase, partial [Acromyrmex insinuator]
MTRQKLRELGWELLMHPPYSPDFAPSNYHLFRSLQNSLDGKTLADKRAAENHLKKFFADKPQKFYALKIIDKFFILLDETTSVANDKMFCVLIKYFSVQYNKVVTKLLELISLDATDCSAEKLYSVFEHCLKSKQIPISNIVGIASDNVSVIVENHNSFMTRLKKEVPVLIILKCICHSSALIASKAYIDFQEFFGVESRKILKLSGTRWLALQKYVERFLEIWKVLKHYFNLETAHGGLTYWLTQVLTSHKCSGEYLCRIAEKRTTQCYHCAVSGHLQHTLKKCLA